MPLLEYRVVVTDNKGEAFIRWVDIALRQGWTVSNGVDLLKGQSKLMSFVESCANTAIGYTVALASQLLVFPLYGIHVPLSTNLWIGAWFTVISIIRSYIVRRGFNWLHNKQGLTSAER